MNEEKRSDSWAQKEHVRENEKNGRKDQPIQDKKLDGPNRPSV